MASNSTECILCGKQREVGEWFFGDLCSNCYSLVQEPSYSMPRYKQNTAYLNLFSAIRSQAIKDGKLEDFEDYWLHGQEMQKVWPFIAEAFFNRSDISLPVSPN